MIFRKLWPNSHFSWFLHIFVWFICWTILSVDFPKGTAISVHCQWTTHKLQLFLFTSCVSIALYAFVRCKGQGCICVEHCPSVGVHGCRKHCNWTFDALRLMRSRLARVRCVCVCMFQFDKQDVYRIYYMFYILNEKLIQNQQATWSASFNGSSQSFVTVLIAMSGIQASQ